MQKYLSSDDCTLWRGKACKPTKFALEAVTQVFNTAISWGQDSTLQLSRGGDLVSHMYLVLDIPGLDAKVVTNGVGGAQFPHENFESGARDSDREVFSLTSVESAPLYQQLGKYAAGNNANASGAACDATNYAEWKAWSAADAPVVYHPSEVSFGAVPPTASFEDIFQARLQALQKAAARPTQTLYGSCGAEEAANPGKLDLNPDSANYGAYDEEEGPWAHWVNAIGFYAVKEARISIGGSVIDTLYNDWLFCYEEIASKAGRRLEEMVGKAYSRAELICDSRAPRRLYVPMPWWFTLDTHNALPLSSLQFHGVSLAIRFAELEDCIVTSKPPPGCSIQVLNNKTKQPIGAQDMQAVLLTTYVYLDTKERTLFSQNSFEQMIHQTQRLVLSSNSQFVRMALTFNHPIIFLMWTIKRAAAEAENDHFNYSGINGEDPLKDVSLSLNNQTRFGGLDGSYYRLVQPYQHFANIPKAHIYCYSFAVDALSTKSNGWCNFSRVDNVELNITLQNHLGSEVVTISVWARSWNVLRYLEGLAGLAFSS